MRSYPLNSSTSGFSNDEKSRLARWLVRSQLSVLPEQISALGNLLDAMNQEAPIRVITARDGQKKEVSSLLKEIRAVEGEIKRLEVFAEGSSLIAEL